MKCQLCHSNEANIVFTQIVNNEKIVLQICTECAQKKGISIEFEKPKHPPEDITVSHTGDDVADDNNGEAEIPVIVCESCGLTFAEFKKSGLFGCEQCHLAFGEYIDTLLKQIHGSSVYDGKTPDTVSEAGKTLKELKRLRRELKLCIEREEYERAASLRDQIAVLEEKSVGT